LFVLLFDLFFLPVRGSIQEKGWLTLSGCPGLVFEDELEYALLRSADYLETPEDGLLLVLI